jgi:hypothetical protein
MDTGRLWNKQYLQLHLLQRRSSTSILVFPSLGNKDRGMGSPHTALTPLTEKSPCITIHTQMLHLGQEKAP